MNIPPTELLLQASDSIEIPPLDEGLTEKTPAELLLQALENIEISFPVEGLTEKNKPLVARLRVLLEVSLSTASAIRDNAIDDGEPLPFAIVESLTTAIEAIAAEIDWAQRWSQSEALPALAGWRLPTHLDLVTQ